MLLIKMLTFRSFQNREIVPTYHTHQMVRKQKIFKSFACNSILQVFGLVRDLKKKEKMEAISYRKCQYLFGTRAPEDVKPGAEVQAHSHAFD